MARKVAAIVRLWLVLPIAGFVVAGCVTPGQSMTERDTVSLHTVERITSATVQSHGRKFAVPGKNAAQLHETLSGYEYRIGPRDILTFTVWDHPELTIPAGEFRSPEIQGHLVGADGTIYFPYIGNVQVADKTLAEVRSIVTGRLAQFIQNPQLDVRVASFRSKRVNVTGEVQRPGILPISDVPMTLIEAVTLAGGVLPTAALQDVRVTRSGQTEVVDMLALLQHGDLSQNRMLEDGDLVHVPDNSFYSVHVLGSVDQAGMVTMPGGRLNLAEVISQSGGFDQQTADARRVFVFRQGEEHPELYWLDARTPDSMLLATQFQMEPQDVIYIDAVGLAKWNRIVSLVLPSIQTLWQTQNFIERVRD